MLKFTTFVSALFLAAWASAQDAIDYIGGVAVGYTGLQFDAKLDSEPLFPALILTGSASLQDFYLTLSYADTLGNTTISEEEDVGEASRTDLDLTLGYRFNEQWNVYLGYKDSETDIDFRERDTTEVRPEFYKSDGFFVGATYLINLNSAGNLSFNFGYVDLTTDNNFIGDADDEEEPVEEFDDLTGRQKGEADGWSYGLNWLIPVNDSLLFNTTYKINKYDESIRFDGQTYKADQTLSFFNVGILYLF
jgi:hypothetical protein